MARELQRLSLSRVLKYIYAITKTGLHLIHPPCIYIYTEEWLT